MNTELQALTGATVDDVFNAVCHTLHVTKANIVGRDRHARIAAARHVTAWLIRKHVHCSYPRIGIHLGGRHHATIIASCRRVDREVHRMTKAGTLVMSIDAMIAKEVTTVEKKNEPTLTDVISGLQQLAKLARMSEEQIKATAEIASGVGRGAVGEALRRIDASGKLHTTAQFLDALQLQVGATAWTVQEFLRRMREGDTGAKPPTKG